MEKGGGANWTVTLDTSTHKVKVDKYRIDHLKGLLSQIYKWQEIYFLLTMKSGKDAKLPFGTFEIAKDG